MFVVQIILNISAITGIVEKDLSQHVLEVDGVDFDSLYPATDVPDTEAVRTIPGNAFKASTKMSRTEAKAYCQTQRAYLFTVLPYFDVEEIFTSLGIEETWTSVGKDKTTGLLVDSTSGQVPYMNTNYNQSITAPSGVATMDSTSHIALARISAHQFQMTISPDATPHFTVCIKNKPFPYRKNDISSLKDIKQDVKDRLERQGLRTAVFHKVTEAMLSTVARVPDQFEIVVDHTINFTARIHERVNIAGLGLQKAIEAFSILNDTTDTLLILPLVGDYFNEIKRVDEDTYNLLAHPQTILSSLTSYVIEPPITISLKLRGGTDLFIIIGEIDEWGPPSLNQTFWKRVGTWFESYVPTSDFWLKASFYAVSMYDLILSGLVGLFGILNISDYLYRLIRYCRQRRRRVPEQPQPAAAKIPRPPIRVHKLTRAPSAPLPAPPRVKQIETYPRPRVPTKRPMPLPTTILVDRPITIQPISPPRQIERHVNIHPHYLDDIPLHLRDSLLDLED